MSIQTQEREQEHTLRGTRLTFLTQAGIALANNMDHVAIEHMWNFMATIPNSHDATKELKDGWEKAKQDANHRFATESKKYQGDYLAQHDFTEKVVPEIEHEADRQFLDICWDAALRYQLIPSE